MVARSTISFINHNLFYQIIWKKYQVAHAATPKAVTEPNNALNVERSLAKNAALRVAHAEAPVIKNKWSLENNIRINNNTATNNYPKNL